MYTLLEMLEDVGNYKKFMTPRDYDRLCGYVLAKLAGFEVEPDEKFTSGQLYLAMKINLTKKIEQRNKRIKIANLRKIENYGY